MDPHAATSFFYPVAVPPLELPASQQTRFPTLQRAGAFLKQAQSPHAFAYDDAAATNDHRHMLNGAAASPTSPSAVAVAASFLASIRRGLNDLAHDANDDEDEDEDEDEGDEDSPRYYTGGSGNTYYAPPLFQSTAASAPTAAARRNRPDDDLIFAMDM